MFYQLGQSAALQRLNVKLAQEASGAPSPPNLNGSGQSVFKPVAPPKMTSSPAQKFPTTASSTSKPTLGAAGVTGRGNSTVNNTTTSFAPKQVTENLFRQPATAALNPFNTLNNLHKSAAVAPRQLLGRMQEGLTVGGHQLRTLQHDALNWANKPKGPVIGAATPQQNVFTNYQMAGGQNVGQAPSVSNYVPGMKQTVGFRWGF